MGVYQRRGNRCATRHKTYSAQNPAFSPVKSRQEHLKLFSRRKQHKNKELLELRFLPKLGGRVSINSLKWK
jgi:hypothetical protein